MAISGVNSANAGFDRKLLLFVKRSQTREVGHLFGEDESAELPPHLKLSEWNWNLVNPEYKTIIKRSMLITGLAVAAVATPWKPVRMWGATVLTAVAYGIINDLFACRVCPEYFTVGHIYDGQRSRNRLVMTLDPNLNALAWGMVATATLAAYGGAFLAVTSSLSKGDEEKIILSMAGYAAITLVAADIQSRIAKARMEQNPQNLYPGVPKQFQSRWHANNVRNSIGYFSLITGAIALAILNHL